MGQRPPLLGRAYLDGAANERNLHSYICACTMLQQGQKGSLTSSAFAKLVKLTPETYPTPADSHQHNIDRNSIVYSRLQARCKVPARL